MKEDSTNFIKFCCNFIENEDVDFDLLPQLNFTEEELAELPEDVLEIYLNTLPQITQEKSFLYQIKVDLKETFKGINQATITAYIISKLYKERRFGRVKLQKILYFIDNQYLSSRNAKYFKFAAGPLDLKLYEYEKYAAKRDWFYTEEKEIEDYINKKQVIYIPGNNLDEAVNYSNRILEDVLDKTDMLINKLKPADTDKCQLYATVHSVWNDIIYRFKGFDQTLIIKYFYKWHPDKKRFTEMDIIGGIKWLKDNELIPHGTSLSTTELK